MSNDYVVKDISLAEFGRKELNIAETEMPGLMALREEFGEAKPLKDARIVGSLHMTIQTGVLIETLVELWCATCAGHRATSSPRKTTQPRRLPAGGTPVFAIKGQSLEEHWDYLDKSFMFPEGPNMILDDGGDATLYILLGRRAGSWRRLCIAVPTSEEEEAIKSANQKAYGSKPRLVSPNATIKGVSEETTTGVHRLYELVKQGQLPFPAINVNDSVTKSKFDNKYGCKESLVDGIRRATDTMMAGKVAVVMGYGDVGKGSAASLAGAGARVKVTEVDPICALQAAMDGFEVVTLEDAVQHRRHFHHDNRQQRRDPHRAHARDEGHGDCWQHWSLRQRNSGRKPEEPQMDQHQRASRHDRDAIGNRLILLSEGRLLNLGNATGHPSFVMSASLHQPGAGPDRTLDSTATNTRTTSTSCPSIWTRKSPVCIWRGSALNLTQLSNEQAAISVFDRRPVQA